MAPRKLAAVDSLWRRTGIPRARNACRPQFGRGHGRARQTPERVADSRCAVCSADDRFDWNAVRGALSRASFKTHFSARNYQADDFPKRGQLRDLKPTTAKNNFRRDKNKSSCSE